MYGMWTVLGRCCADKPFRDAARNNAGTHSAFHNFLHDRGNLENNKALRRVSLWEAGDIRRILTDVESTKYLDEKLADAYDFTNIAGPEDWPAIIGLSLIDSSFRTKLVPRLDEPDYQGRVTEILWKYGLTMEAATDFTKVKKIYGNPDCVDAMLRFNVYFWIYPQCEPKATANEIPDAAQVGGASAPEFSGDQYVHVSCKWEQKLREAALANNIQLDQRPQPGASVQVGVPKPALEIAGPSKANGQATAVEQHKSTNKRGNGVPSIDNELADRILQTIEQWKKGGGDQPPGSSPS